MQAADSARVALVLVDHGSRNADANAVVELAARDVAGRDPDRFVAVLAAHMELASPSLREAFAAAAAKGAEVLVVVVFFLGPGRHSQRDIPALVASAAAEHPGLRVVICEPLGPDTSLADLALMRAEQGLARTPSAPSRRRGAD